MKPRLFICGDSWTDWPLPPTPSHWIDYLEDDFEVIRLGLRGCSNYDIFSQIGNIPSYIEGDRVIVVWTSPSRVRNLTESLPTDSNKKNLKWFQRIAFPTIDFNPIRIRRSELWNDLQNNYFEGEANFIQKIKVNMLKEYSPLFYTWDEEFWNRTSSFVSLFRDIETLHDAFPDKTTLDDLHPSANGCYSIYKTVHSDLNLTTPLKAKVKILV